MIKVRPFDHIDLVNFKKLILCYERQDSDESSDDIEYYVELLDKPTNPYLQGKLIQNERWYKHTRSDLESFHREWGDIKTIKEVNKRLREGFIIKEIIKSSK